MRPGSNSGAVVVAAAGEHHRDRVDARTATVKAALETAGVEVFEPDHASREEFRRIAQPAYMDELERTVALEWITLALEGAGESDRAEESEQ
ncbi:MAG: hypothetical protein ACLFPO_02275 [Spirochaetaceae bacterium]